MAAVCGGILANKNSPADFLHKNLDMASNIFHAARKVGCRNVYTLGSVCAYPKHCKTPFMEEDLWNGYPEETNAPYGIAKRTLLMLGNTYREQYGIGGAHLIPVNMYGEHDHFDPVNSHVIPALIRKFDDAVTNGKKMVECWGTGQATREFLYAGDAAQAIVKAVESGLSTDLPINLGRGEDISIKDLALLIGKLTGFDADDAVIKFNGEVSDGQPKRLLSTYRASKLLGWTAGTHLEDGLRCTIDWYRANRQQIIAEDAS
jgi:GDP-L-fucose synthase